VVSEKSYQPYKAINVFFEREYLELVIREILEGLESLNKEEQAKFNSFFRRHVTVLGFRNSLRAPLSLKTHAFASAFEEKEDVIPYTLSTWTKIKSNLSTQVKEWLESEGWTNLALERDFSVDEGFLSQWPEGFNFEEIEEKFQKAYPEESPSRDDLILMVIWISGNLPKGQSDL